MFKKNKKEIDLLNKLEKNVLTPVTFIQGYSAILKNNKNLSSDILEQINRIDLASGRILNTVQSLLMIYELELNKKKIKLESVKLLSVTYSALEKYIRLAKSRKIKFDFEGQNTNSVISNKKFLIQALSVLSEEIFLILEKGNISVLVKKEGSDMTINFEIVFVNDTKVKISETSGYELAKKLLNLSKNKISFDKKGNIQKINIRLNICED